MVNVALAKVSQSKAKQCCPLKKPSVPFLGSSFVVKTPSGSDKIAVTAASGLISSSNGHFITSRSSFFFLSEQRGAGANFSPERKLIIGLLVMESTDILRPIENAVYWSLGTWVREISELTCRVNAK